MVSEFPVPSVGNMLFDEVTVISPLGLGELLLTAKNSRHLQMDAVMSTIFMDL